MSFQVVKGSLRGQGLLWRRQEEEHCPRSRAGKGPSSGGRHQGQQAWARRSQDAWSVGYRGLLEPWETGRGQQAQAEGHFCGAGEEGARRFLLGGPLNFPFSTVSHRKPLKANHSYGKANSCIKESCSCREKHNDLWDQHKKEREEGKALGPRRGCSDSEAGVK